MVRPVLSIVIPAYNEAARIGRGLDATCAFLDGRSGAAEVIVVDDGSRDATAQIVEGRAQKDPRIRLIQLGENRGKGAAVRTGVLASRGARVLFMDADLATPLDQLAKLERALDEGADLAFGSRAASGANVMVRQHPLREAMGRTFNVIVRAIAISQYRDTQCGFKLFTREAADAIFAEATVDRFAFDVELLLLAQGRFRIAEVPVDWRHVDESKVSPLHDALRMLYDIARLRATFALRGRRHR